MNNLHVLLLFLCLFSELWGYKNYTVENECPTNIHLIKLGSGVESSVIISQRGLSDHRMAWAYDYKCTFDVKALGGFGVFAVIQSMKLRRNPITNVCMDYIQFESSEGSSSLSLCGDLDAHYVMDHEYDDYFGDYSYESGSNNCPACPSVSFMTDGILTVHIFIDRRPLKRGELIDFTIAVTGYRQCRNARYKACDDDRFKCIYESFFHDGVINCPYYDCIDEGGCRVLKPLNVDEPVTIGSRFLLGSATVVVISFIVVVLGMYNCRKYCKFRWSEPPPAQTIPQMAPSVAETVSLHNLTAPSSPTPQDKNMPPSYASLLPSVTASYRKY